MDNIKQESQQQMQMDSSIVKLRGLPWNVTPKEILQFLDGVQVEKGENGVHLITSPRDGRPNGEAFVECATEADVAKAFEYQNKTLGHRYIEIFNAQVDEFESVLNKQHVVQMDTFIKLRGLPYSITAEEIEQFFEGLQLNKDQDVHIVMDNRGRASGEAFVRFGNLDDTEKALKRNREKIGHRYIEIFRSTNSEFRRNMYGTNRPGPYDRNNGGGMGNGGGAAGGGGMGMGGGGPIRNNFNGPRGRMMRGGGSDSGNNGPWKSRPSYDNFYEDDGYNNGCAGGNQNNTYNNGGGTMGGSGGMGGGFGGGNANGGGYRGNNDYSNSFAMAGNRFSSGGGAGIGGSAFSTSSSMGIGAGGVAGGGMNTMGMSSFATGGGGYNGNGAFGGSATGGLGMGTGLNSAGQMGGVGAGMGNNGGVGTGGYRNNNGNGFNDYSQGNSYGNGGGGNSMGNGQSAWRDNNGGGNGGGGGMSDTFCVHMRGMPYYCDEQDIYKFFAPLKPINCQVIYNNRGLHSGEADAVFANQADAMQAMAKNKEKMGTRYIELFYKNGNNQNQHQDNNMNNNMNRRRY